MTATAVVPTTTAPAASRVAATGPREPSTGADMFDRQLHAARQQQEPTHDSADATSRQPAQETPRESEHKPVHAKPVHASKGGHADDASPPPSRNVSGEAVTPPTGEVAAAVTADSPQADPGRDTEVDGDQAGATLAGSMLALLGLSSGVAFAAAATMGGSGATSADTGKVVTTDARAVDASAAALLQANAVDSAVAATATGMISPGAGTQPAGDDQGLPAVGKAADHTADLASVLALPATVTAAAPAVTHQLQLPSSVGSQAFAHELGQQVAWLTGQDVKQARIRLHPEELGQLDVKINVSHDRVDVVFSAQHPAAVTAIQQSLSQLGQMLTQQGLSLGHAEVGQHDHGENQGRGGATPNDAVVDDADEVHGIGLRTSIGAVGLLDAFA